MRFSLLPWIALAAPFLTYVAAERERGAAERMLYYICYQAEEQIKIMDASYAYTVAPGCSGTRPGGRCTFDEFLREIWGPKPGEDKTPPTSMSTASRVPDNLALSFSEFFGRTNNAAFDAGGGTEPRSATGRTDSSKLFPNEGDYYDVLSKIGAKIELLSSTTTTTKTKPNNYMMKLWKWGKASTFLTESLRRKDMDTFRADTIRDYAKSKGISINLIYKDLNEDIGIEADGWTEYKMKGGKPELDKDGKPIPNPKAKPSFGQPVKVLDFDAILADPGNAGIKDLDTHLDAANKQWLAVKKDGKPINAEHLKAMKSAKASRLLCKCQKGVPRELKRGLVSAIKTFQGIFHGPKAAKSRQMKAKLLAESGYTKLLKTA